MHKRYFTYRRICVAAAVSAAVVSVGLWLLGSWPKGEAQLTLTFSHFEKHFGRDNAVFEIASTGNRTASIDGNGWEFPFYYVVTQNGTNWSWDHTPGFDESQARPVKLPPGTSMPVRTAIPNATCWKVGISYRNATLRESVPRKIWQFLRCLVPSDESDEIVWSDSLTQMSLPTNVVQPLPEAK